MATCEERNQMAQVEEARRMRERTPFTETFIRSTVECPRCFDLCVVAVSKNGKEMLMDCEPDTRKTKGIVGWKLSLVVHEGKPRLRADFLDPFDRGYQMSRGKKVWRCHWNHDNPECKEAWKRDGSAK